MRIGINARFLYSEILEGIGRYTWEITKNMVLQNPESTFILFVDRPIPERYSKFNNIEIVKVGPPARHPLLFYAWYEWSLARAVRQKNIDVFYSPDNFMSLSLDCPTLLVIHDLSYLHYPAYLRSSHLWYYKHFTPKFVKSADHIATVSTFVKDDVINQFNIDPSKVSVIYNALPPRKKNESESAFDFPYFIYVGSLNPRKNIKTALSAFLRFKKTFDRYKFIFIGNMFDLESQTKTLIHEGIEEGYLIHMQGMKDHELNQYIQKAAALVYISHFEGFGIPILEAMDLSTPVITSDVTSMPEVAGDAAILVDPEQVDEVVNAMESIVSDNDLRSRLIQKGIERVKFFSWAKSAEQTYHLLQKLCNRDEPSNQS